MANQVNPTVQQITQDAVLLPTGAVERRVRVAFMVGTHGPFTVSIPQAEFTADRARQEMEKIAAPIRQLGG